MPLTYSLWCDWRNDGFKLADTNEDVSAKLIDLDYRRDWETEHWRVGPAKLRLRMDNRDGWFNLLPTGLNTAGYGIIGSRAWVRLFGLQDDFEGPEGSLEDRRLALPGGVNAAWTLSDTIVPAFNDAVEVSGGKVSIKPGLSFPRPGVWLFEDEGQHFRKADRSLGFMVRRRGPGNSGIVVRYANRFTFDEVLFGSQSTIFVQRVNGFVASPIARGDPLTEGHDYWCELWYEEGKAWELRVYDLTTPDISVSSDGWKRRLGIVGTGVAVDVAGALGRSGLFFTGGDAADSLDEYASFGDGKTLMFGVISGIDYGREDGTVELVVEDASAFAGRYFLETYTPLAAPSVSVPATFPRDSEGVVGLISETSRRAGFPSLNYYFKGGTGTPDEDVLNLGGVEGIRPLEGPAYRVIQEIAASDHRQVYLDEYDWLTVTRRDWPGIVTGQEMLTLRDRDKGPAGEFWCHWFLRLEERLDLVENYIEGGYRVWTWDGASEIVWDGRLGLDVAAGATEDILIITDFDLVSEASISSFSTVPAGVKAQVVGTAVALTGQQAAKAIPLRFTNNSAASVRIDALTLRGFAVERGGYFEYLAQDADSIAKYGRRSARHEWNILTLSGPLRRTLDLTLAERKHPPKFWRAVVPAVDLPNALAVSNLRLGDPVAVAFGPAPAARQLTTYISGMRLASDDAGAVTAEYLLRETVAG